MHAASTICLLRVAAPATRVVSGPTPRAAKPFALLLSALSLAGAAAAADAPVPAASTPAVMPAAVRPAEATAAIPPRPRAEAPPVHAGHAPGAPALATYLSQRGETLDAVIKKTMGDSPLRIELLRQAFVQANTHIFPSGKAGRLPAGVVLHVPDHIQLVRAALIPMLQPAESYLGGTASASSEERRRWVRFP